MHLIIEAFKLAYMDRHNFYGDPYMVKVPAKGLMSKAYADERRKLIDQTKAAMEVPAGDPWKYEGKAGRPAQAGPGPGTRLGGDRGTRAADRHHLLRDHRQGREHVLDHVAATTWGCGGAA